MSTSWEWQNQQLGFLDVNSGGEETPACTLPAHPPRYAWLGGESCMHGGPWAGQSSRVSAGVPEQNSFTLPRQGHLAMSGGWASGRWPGTLLNTP